KAAADVATREVRKLEKKLAAAREVKAHRLAQLAAAQAGKGKKEIAKRSRQAKSAAADVASLAKKVAASADAAASGAARAARGPAKDGGPASANPGAA